MSIGARVRQIREQRGMPQVDLARAAGVQQTYLSRLEAGSRDSRPNAVVLSRIARALDVSMEELILDDPVPSPPDHAFQLRLARLAHLFRSLSPSRQDDALALLEALSKQP